MSKPRFQLVTGHARLPTSRANGSVVTARHSDPAAPLVTWRLLGSNNREMGRSVETFDTIDECRDSVMRLKRAAASLTSRVVTADSRGNWGWALFLGDEQLARSARLFSRLREARTNVEQFIEKAPDAAIVQLGHSVSAMARRASLTGGVVVGPTKERP